MWTLHLCREPGARIVMHGWSDAMPPGTSKGDLFSRTHVRTASRFVTFASELFLWPTRFDAV